MVKKKNIAPVVATELKRWRKDGGEEWRETEKKKGEGGTSTVGSLADTADTPRWEHRMRWCSSARRGREKMGGKEEEGTEQLSGVTRQNLELGPQAGIADWKRNGKSDERQSVG